jgi:hypothetical protein
LKESGGTSSEHSEHWISFFSILKWLFVKLFLCFCFFAFVSLKAHFLEKKGFKKEKEKEKEKKYVRAQAEHKHR